MKLAVAALLAAVCAGWIPLVGAQESASVAPVPQEERVVFPGDARDAILARAKAARLNLRVRGNGSLCISLDETTTRADIDALWGVFAAEGATLPSVDALDASAPSLIPGDVGGDQRHRQADTVAVDLLQRIAGDALAAQQPVHVGQQQVDLLAVGDGRQRGGIVGGQGRRVGIGAHEGHPGGCGAA